MEKDTDVVYIYIRMETCMMGSGENQENMAGVFTGMPTVKGAHFLTRCYFTQLYTAFIHMFSFVDEYLFVNISAVLLG